jgi:hypothetical protein
MEVLNQEKLLLKWQEDGVIMSKIFLIKKLKFYSQKEIFGAGRLLLVEAQMILLDIKSLVPSKGSDSQWFNTMMYKHYKKPSVQIPTSLLILLNLYKDNEVLLFHQKVIFLLMQGYLK